MTFNLYRISVLLLFIGFSTVAFTQSWTNRKISATFSNQTFPQILQQLEQDYTLRFYYPPAALPEGTFSFSFQETPLLDVLNRLTANTSLGFVIYRDYAIILARQEVLGQEYSSNFYQALEDSRTEDETEQEYVIGSVQNINPNGFAKLSGTVLTAETQEPIIGATIFFPELDKGSSTDVSGDFEIELPTGKHAIEIQFIGYEGIASTISIYSDGALEFLLHNRAIDLQTVTVKADAPDVNVESVQIGVSKLDMQTIKKLPSFLGEVDVVKSLLLQPGISTIGEGASGFNVRGGDVDQNLIMQDEAFIFNSSHALGFFSVFNSDLINTVAVYKSIMPAQYGGRLASVLDVELRNGDFQKLRFKGGVGPISSRISAEGPVIKDKSAFIVGFRASYSDWVLQSINVPEVKESSASFYDLNGRYTHRINEKNSLTFSGYAAHDNFRYAQQFGYEYSTKSAQLTYRSIFTNKFFSNLSATWSQYESIQYDLDGNDGSELNNEVTYFKIKELLTFTPIESLELIGGLSSIYYIVEPGAIKPSGELSTVRPAALETENGLETAAFINAEWTISPALSVSGGLRVALYNYLGPQTVFQYAEGELPVLENIIDTTYYSGTDAIKTYASIEPRLSARYRFSAETSVKAGYSRTTQFINQISNADTPTPTSLWQLSKPYIEPQRSHNFSLGIFRNFENNAWESSAEVYYRIIDELFDYKDFAKLTVNEHLETELLPGEGRAYGLELTLKKKTGLFNGWIGYTLSRTERQVPGINQGEWYLSNFDKPHDLTLVTNIQFNKRNSISFNFNYSTGRPTTAPVGVYRLPNGLSIPDYSQRNQLRIPDYHRLDVAYTIGQSLKKVKKFKTSWTLSVYNIYGRRNAYSVFFTQQPFQGTRANRLSILGGAFPSLTFNFELL